MDSAENSANFLNTQLRDARSQIVALENQIALLTNIPTTPTTASPTTSSTISPTTSSTVAPITTPTG